MPSLNVEPQLVPVEAEAGRQDDHVERILNTARNLDPTLGNSCDRLRDQVKIRTVQCLRTRQQSRGIGGGEALLALR